MFNSKSERGRRDASNKLFIQIGRLLPCSAEKRKNSKKKMLVEEKEEDCAVWFCVTVAITISDFCVFFFILSRRYSCHPCFLLYYIISEWCCKFMCTVWTYCMCAYGGDVRVSPGRCFIFVMKYIKLTYTQARIMFISFVSFRCLSEEMQWGRVEAAGPAVQKWGMQPLRHGNTAFGLF